jgi:hypothetical protein
VVAREQHDGGLLLGVRHKRARKRRKGREGEDVGKRRSRCDPVDVMEVLDTRSVA